MIAVASVDAQRSRFERRFGPFADATNPMIDLCSEAARRERPRHVRKLAKAIEDAMTSGKAR